MKSRNIITMFTALLAAPLLLLASGCGGDEASKQPATPAQANAQDNAKANAKKDAQAARATAQDTAAPQAPGMQRMMQRCPMMVEGVDVRATDTENGIAMVFTTTKGDVEDLRNRVRGMAEMYNTQHAQGGFQWHRMGQGAGMGGGQGMRHGAGTGAGKGMGPMPAAVATVENVEGGARLVLIPRDPAQREALRARVRMHVERMRGHECPMMMMGQQQ